MSIIRPVLALLLALAAQLLHAQPLTVSAAASLSDAFREIGKAFEATRPGVVVRFNFAAS
ncbi:MAG: molybdate ABC transporter substrate-binding protein, partial [Betaproteobacteria bacterium]|nr:molybdate ABC transporter substrate-binding protein [Betaproteobacteria bacterium]